MDSGRVDCEISDAQRANFTDYKHDSYKEVEHPLRKAGILAKLFFWWMLSFFRHGYKKQLVQEDLYEVLPEDSSGVLVEQLEREWNKELEKSRNTDILPSLRKALMKTFGRRFVLYSIPIFLEETFLKVVQPLMLSRLVLYISTDTVSVTEAYLQACGIPFTALLILMLHHGSFFGFERMGMRIRIACSSLIYRKALRLSHLALKETTISQLVNILSNDVNRFDEACVFLHYIWIAPIQLIVVAVLLWREIGVSCLAGVSFFLLLAPLQLYMGNLFSKFRAKTALLTDARIRIMNEVICGILVIKIHAWEESFGQLVCQARRKEIRKIMHSSYLRATTMSLWFTGSILVALFTFLVYATLGNPVTSSKVFPVLLLFYAVKLPATVYFAGTVMNATESMVSIRRIENFLLMEEIGIQADKLSVDAISGAVIESTAVKLEELQTSSESNEIIPQAYGQSNLAYDEDSVANKAKTQEQRGECSGYAHATSASRPGIVVRNLHGCWTKDLSNATLQDITFCAEPGEFLAVIGPVGCGKSSLLMALLGELPAVSGDNIINGQVGYASQQPWIFSGSFRENILFGRPYLPGRYKKVVKMCALVRDMDLLPDGDLTVVGEHGVTLSGGQRARVSLARVVYSEADVYLLDDPLSSIDPAVGRHLFERCLLHHLRDKPKILVTHQLQFLDKVDRILILEEGKVTGYGTYKELQEHGVDFATLLKKKPDKAECDGEDEISKNVNVHVHLETRRASTISVSSFCPKPDEQVGPHVDIAPEEKAVGTVAWRVYLRYFQAASGLFLLPVWILIVLGTQALFVWTDLRLVEWTKKEEMELVATNITQGYQNITDFKSRFEYIRTYVILCGVTSVAVFARGFILFHLFVNASKALHHQMSKSIIRASLQFFDVNPVGRVLNRFSKDVGFTDELLPNVFSDFLQATLYTLSVVIVVTVFNPICVVFVLPIFLLFLVIRRYFLASSRDIKRLEAIARSPVFSHLSVTLTGLTTVRAFKAQRRFTADFDRYQDNHTKAWFMFLATSRCLAVQLDTLVVIFICGVSFASVFASDLLGLDSGIVGLLLTYAISLTGAFQWAVRQSADLEIRMTSVERMCQYIDIKSEAPLDTDNTPAPDWPKSGMITLEDVSLSYSDDGPLVLENISCCIRPKEKVGIVGRTGAGKSSLMTALMRLAEPIGTITIDGINIAEIGLHDLRKKVSFIPQNPVLFSGTLRKNLDPFGDHSDLDVWKALEQVQLQCTIEKLPDKLESQLTEGGSNFSVGQRQLLCLARAILRKNKILTVDEATANVDIRTDTLIQATIRECFKHCTVLTIAHRINTIMDSDRVMVLDAGKMVDFDEPCNLLQKKEGIFTRLVRETGLAEEQRLLKIAEQKCYERNRRH